MKIKFKDRYGNEVEFEKKPKTFYQLPGESFLTALVRTYYPAVHRECEEMRRNQKLQDIFS